MELLYMSLGGTLIICAVFLARLLLQNRVHRTVWLILWAVAALRLLLPFTVASSVSVFNLSVFAPVPAAASTAATSSTIPSAAIAVQPSAQDTPQISIKTVLVSAWLAGSVMVGGYFVASHLRARRRYRFAIPTQLPDVDARIRVKELEGLQSPLTYGVFTPVVLLPGGMKEDTERCRRVLAHELAHIRHGDVAHKAVLLAAVAVHWFNPFVWLMLFTASQDMEMRCDADAIRALNGARSEYAKTLIQAEETKLRGYLQAGFSFSSTAQRLQAIMKNKAARTWSICAGVVLTAVLLAVFCTGQRAPEVQTAAPETASVLQMQSPAEPQQNETRTASVQTEQPTDNMTAPTELTEQATELTEPTPKPTEPTEPVNSPVPTEQPTKPTTESTEKPTEPITELTEPTQPLPSEDNTDENDAPSYELPTSYYFPNPGSFTLRLGEAKHFSLQSIAHLSFSGDGNIGVEIDCTVSNGVNELRTYEVSVYGKEEGVFQIYCTTSYGITILWATVTVLP